MLSPFTHDLILQGDLELQNNMMSGTIPFDDCGQFHTLMSDCWAPKYIKCACCTECFGLFNSNRDILPCPSTTLVVVYGSNLTGSTRINIGFKLQSAIESSIITQQLIRGKTNMPNQSHFSSCISPTACYKFLSDASTTSKILVNNRTIVNNLNKRSNGTFGYSSDDIMKPNSCEDYMICNRILKPGTMKRNLFDLVTKLSIIGSSEHIQSICWWLEDLDKKSPESLNDIAHIQRYILALLYFSAGGLQWHNQNKWLSNDSVCNWYGVFCEVPGIVSKIEITSNNMQGNIPIELGELAGLESLKLSSNELTGEIPVELVKLQNLKTLMLSKNMFSGSIHSEIRYLEELRYLDISANRLTSTIPIEIGTLHNLEYISIANNSISGRIPKELTNLVNLKSIIMADNLLRGSVPVSNSMIYLGKKNIFVL